MDSYKVSLLAVFFILLIYGCHPDNRYERRSHFIMGTLVEITAPRKYADESASAAKLMQNLSSIISNDTKAISSSASIMEINKITYDLLKAEEYYSKISGGRFNSRVFTVSSLYGFPEGPYAVPDNESLKKAKKLSASRVELSENEGRYYATGNGVKIDLGAFAKGWIVDRASEYLLNNGVADFIINAGGDLYASGTKGKTSWRLGIADPYKNIRHIDTVQLRNKALATSGSYERYFISADGRHISHIFDGVTGEPADNYLSVSVIADTTERADALSTIYFLIDEADIARLCESENSPVLIMRADGAKQEYCGWAGFRSE